MPIPFSTIPEHIRVSIIEKDSKVLLAFFGKEKLCIPWNLLTTIPVRIEANKLIHSVITNKICDWLINFSISTHSFFGCLDARYIRCSSTKFSDLYRTLRIKNIFCFYEISIEFLRSIDPTNINEIDVLSPLNDSDLSALKMPRMNLFGTKISNSGINSLIKQWIANLRDIKDISISVAGVVKYQHIFDGIGYNVEDNEDAKYSEAYSITKDDSNRLIVKIRDSRVNMLHVP